MPIFRLKLFNLIERRALIEYLVKTSIDAFQQYFLTCSVKINLFIISIHTCLSSGTSFTNNLTYISNKISFIIQENVLVMSYKFDFDS